MELGERKLRILKAIIDDYILTGVPVGSRTISKKYEQRLSSATIRNEMSDLEDLGYLDSPHTSAGRVPSPKAYRLYVDNLLHQLQVTQVNDQIAEHFEKRFQQVQDVAEYAAQTLSDATQYTSVVMTHPTPDHQSRVSSVQLVWVSAGKALLVLSLDSGDVRQTLIPVGRELGMDDLYQVSRILTEQLAGAPLAEMSERLSAFAEQWKQHTALIGSILTRVQEAEQSEKPKVVVGGSANLLNYPEYNDVEKARKLLNMLETREKLTQLLVTTSPMEFVIRIGPETGMPETQDCSVVTASYRIRGDTMNTVGIIGPTRMQYGRVLNLLQGMGKTLSTILNTEQEDR